MRRVLTAAGWTSRAEERANTITSGMSAALAVASLVLLIVVAAEYGDARRIVTATIFGTALVLLYAVSTAYHAWPMHRRLRHALRVSDHAAIFIAIAASYTPFLLVYLSGTLAWTLLTLLWTLAFIGVVTKVRSFHASHATSLLLYLAMGWIGIFAARPFLETMPGGCVAWVIAGGLAYTAGTVFFAWQRLPFHHAIWHCFVTAGSACHVVAVMRYVVPVSG